MIPVTKPFIPDRRNLQRYLDQACDRAWLTNQGPLVRELTARLEDYLGVQNLLLVANGTLALQMAFRALSVKGDAITTPFTFAATASALKWQGITPRFADIDPESLTLSPVKAEEAATPTTGALVPVHVFGTPCSDEFLQSLAKRKGWSLIYDASHAFGVRTQSQSLLSYGDASTLSFHATKLFHTVEGGAIVFKDADALDSAQRMVNFGLDADHPEDITSPGINAKLSEIHAAFGLANLDQIGEILEQRSALLQEYESQLRSCVTFPASSQLGNASYCPVIFDSPHQRSTIDAALRTAGIHARRYFYPALHETTQFRDGSQCPVASRIADTVLCLPIYPDLAREDVRRICRIVKENLRAIDCSSPSR